MDVRPILIDLSKLRHPVPQPPGEEHASLASYLLLEGQVGTGKQTNGHMTIVDRGKTTRIRVGKARRHQLVANPRRSGGDEILAIVTHRRYSNRCEYPPSDYHCSPSKRRSFVRRDQVFGRIAHPLI